MRAIEILTKEHRLIAKMITLIQKQVELIEKTSSVDTTNLDTIIDFFRRYTHRHHHWKEEDILFKKLEEKQIQPDIDALVKSLINEHQMLKRCIGNLVKFSKAFSTGQKGAIEEILKELNILIKFYPLHIQKEDGTLFPQVPQYLTPEEQQVMDVEFEKIEQNMIHDQYNIIVENFESSLTKI
ncbi:hemerythrin domain-containing protein [Patescibacteria group bacterium]